MINIFNKKLIYILLFFGILSGSIFIRMYQLDKYGFWSDELYHVIAAQGILTTGHPSFPGGVEYKRALSFTYLVSQSFKIFGINEIAARIPSILFNVLFLIISFWIVKTWFNTNVALMFLTVMSFSNYEIFHTRQCRMYTAFQLVYFLGTYFFWMGFEQIKNMNDRNISSKFIHYKYNIIFIIFSGSMFFLSYRFHQLTIIFGLVLTTYVVSLFLIELKTKSVLDSIKSKYGIFTITIVGIALLILVLTPNVYEGYYQRIISLPGWKIGRPVDIRLFSWVLRSESTVFFFLYPISAMYLLKKDMKKGLYIFFSFTIPFIFHSFVFMWKEERFMFYFFPFYALTVTIFAEEIIIHAWNAKDKLDFNIKILNRLVPICVVFSFFILLYPWFFHSRDVYKKQFMIDWKPALNKIYPNLNKQSTIITLLDDQSYLYYYLKRTPDYFIAPIIYYDDEESEYKYFDSKQIRNLEEFKYISDQYNDVWFIANKHDFFNKHRYFRPNILTYIENNFINYPVEGNKNILIFRKYR